MAFLEALSGLVEGVDIGLQRRREQKNIESERAFRLKQFNAEMRRAAMLDALSEEVQKSRLELMNRAQQLQEDQAEREARNAEEIPVTIGDQVFRMPRMAAERLSEAQAQMEIMNQYRIPLSTGGFGDPEFVAQLSRQADEDRKRRQMAIKELVAERETALMASMPEQEARKRALEFGKILFPEEMADLNLNVLFPPNRGLPPRPGELPFGLFGRAGLAVKGISQGLAHRLGLGEETGEAFRRAAFAEDPTETLREEFYGPSPLEQALASREEARRARELQARKGLAASAVGGFE